VNRRRRSRAALLCLKKPVGDQNFEGSNTRQIRR
jgi:hypothetical protein